MSSAAPTRTHNNESANDTTQTRKLWSRKQGEVVEMGIANANAIYAMLSDLSSNPGQYVLREAQSNAYDATMRTGKLPATIEMWLPQEGAVIEDGGIAAQLGNDDASTKTLTVIDHGCGMSYEEVCQNYLQYGGSDKTDELDSIGSKGLGAKAPLAIADSFDVTTTKDGVTTHAHITRRPRSAGVADVYSEHTGRESGTTVVVPIANSTLLDQMWQFIHSLKGFSAGITLMVNGKPIRPKLPLVAGQNSDEYICLGLIDVATNPPCQMRAWQKYSASYDSYNMFPEECTGATDYVRVSALVGGVLYPLEHDSESPHFIVEVDPGWLDFTPSRDEVKKCESTERFTATLKEALSNVDTSAILEAHIMVASTRTLALIRSCTEFKAPTQSGRRGYGLDYPKDAFRFFESAFGQTQVQHKNKTYDIPRYAYDRVRDCEIDADAIILSYVGSTKKSTMVINGMNVPKAGADAYIGHRDQTHNMRAIVSRDTTTNVIRDVRSRDDASWVIRNEAALRSIGAIKWDSAHASIILIDDPASVDPEIRSLLSSANTMTLASAKAKVASVNAARRAELKQEREAAKRQPITQQSWARNTVSTLEIKRDASEEELVLWMVDESQSSLPKAHDNVTLNTLQATPNELAVIIVDNIDDRFSNVHDAACAFLLAMRKDPTCVPDDVRYLVVTDAKRFQARDFTTMIENGAFLVADRRSKLKSIRTDGLADKRPDLLEIDSGLNATADVSGISDHLLLAKLLEFAQPISGEDFRHCANKVTYLATHALDESLLAGDALAAARNVRELFSQYKVKITRRNYGSDHDAYPITLCGHDINSNNLGYGYGWRRGHMCVRLRAKGVPKDVLQVLEDASQMSMWFNDLLSSFGLSTMQSDVCVTGNLAPRLKTFSAAISADMLAHFTRKVI